MFYPLFGGLALGVGFAFATGLACGRGVGLRGGAGDHAAMKVSKPYITKVLRQDVNFSFRTAPKLARALEMDFFPELREKS